MTPEEMVELMARARYLLKTDAPMRGTTFSSILKTIKFFDVVVSHFKDGHVEIGRAGQMAMKFRYDSGVIHVFFGDYASKVLRVFRREMLLDDIANV